MEESENIWVKLLRPIANFGAGQASRRAYLPRGIYPARRWSLAPTCYFIDHDGITFCVSSSEIRIVSPLELLAAQAD